jgi:hypothetical protein
MNDVVDGPKGLRTSTRPGPGHRVPDIGSRTSARPGHRIYYCMFRPGRKNSVGTSPDNFMTASRLLGLGSAYSCLQPARRRHSVPRLPRYLLSYRLLAEVFWLARFPQHHCKQTPTYRIALQPTHTPVVFNMESSSTSI